MNKKKTLLPNVLLCLVAFGAVGMSAHILVVALRLSNYRFAAFAIVLGIMFSIVASLMLSMVRREVAQVLRISHPPGWGLRGFAEFCFSKKTYTQVLEPALSDLEKEHFEALAEGRPWKARMSLVRNYWAFWSAVVKQLPIPFVRLVYKIWKTTNSGS